MARPSGRPSRSRAAGAPKSKPQKVSVQNARGKTISVSSRSRLARGTVAPKPGALPQFDGGKRGAPKPGVLPAGTINTRPVKPIAQADGGKRGVPAVTRGVSSGVTPAMRATRGRGSRTMIAPAIKGRSK